MTSTIVVYQLICILDSDEPVVLRPSIDDIDLFITDLLTLKSSHNSKLSPNDSKWLLHQWLTPRAHTIINDRYEAMISSISHDIQNVASGVGDGDDETQWKVYDEAPYVPTFDELKLSSADLTYLFNDCARHAEIINSTAFKIFLRQCSGHGYNSNIDIGQPPKYIYHEPSSPFARSPRIPTSQGNHDAVVHLLLQPLEPQLVYIPRRDVVIIDVDIPSNDTPMTLVWKLSVERGYEVDFGVVLCRYDVEVDTGRQQAINVLDEYMTRTDGLRTIGLSAPSSLDTCPGDQSASVQVQVLEPLIRLQGSSQDMDVLNRIPVHPPGESVAIIDKLIHLKKKNASQVPNGASDASSSTWNNAENKENLKSNRSLSNTSTSTGPSTVSYLSASASNCLMPEREPHLQVCSYDEQHEWLEGSHSTAGSMVRFVFDNSFSNVFGKYVEFAYQIVDAGIVQAAERVVEDKQREFTSLRSEVYDRIVDCHSLEFVADGPWIVHRVKHPSDDLLPSSLKELEHAEESPSNPPGLMNSLKSAIEHIPVAGPMMLSMTDSVVQYMQQTATATSVNISEMINDAVTSRGFLFSSATNNPSNINTAEESVVSVSLNQPSAAENILEQSFAATTQSTSQHQNDDVAIARDHPEFLSEETAVEMISDPSPSEQCAKGAQHSWQQLIASSNSDLETKLAAASVMQPVPEEREEDRLLKQRCEQVQRELEDYKRYCQHLRRRIYNADMQSEQQLQSLHQAHQQTLYHKALTEKELSDLRNNNQELRETLKRVKAERKALRDELLALKKLGLYEGSIAMHTHSSSRGTTSTTSADHNTAMTVEVPECNREQYAQLMTSLRGYRQQVNGLQDLLAADPGNDTLTAMITDFEKNIRELQDQVASLLNCVR